MSGLALPVMPKRIVDFATLPVGGIQELVLSDRVGLVHWRELTLRVRVHSHTLVGNNQIAIRVYPQSWTEEDPGIQFLATATTAASITASTPSPGLLSGSLPMLGASAIPAMARIVAVGTRTISGTMNAALSLEFSTKDS